MKSKWMCRTFLLIAAGMIFSGVAKAQDTIKVGILHSLSGTMAISETTLKDTDLMMIEEQNKKGGLLGKKLEAVVVDPASDWPLFAETEYTDPRPSYRQKTTDVEIGYIMKQFDARLYAYGRNVSFNSYLMENYWDAGLGLQLQLSKQILGP